MCAKTVISPMCAKTVISPMCAKTVISPNDVMFGKIVRISLLFLVAYLRRVRQVYMMAGNVAQYQMKSVRHLRLKNLRLKNIYSHIIFSLDN